MAKPNSRKSQEQFDIADNDRISKLPDSILCHILSFLSTKYSVQTSILSRRWRFTWTAVAVLDLNDHFFIKWNHARKRRRISASVKSFNNFVNMVLILRSHPCIQRFRLNLTNSYPPLVVNSWILAAITHNVEQLELSMEHNVKLPRTLFSCATMVVLKLAYDIDLDFPESVSLPNLKVVHFESLKSLCDSTINSILSGSPILEELVIKRDREDGVEIFSIQSSSLKTLIIKNSLNHLKLVIDAPKLEYLKLIDRRRDAIVESIEFKNASSLVESTFKFPVLPCHLVPKHIETTCSLNEIRNVQVLSAPLFMLKTVLSRPYIRFSNLTQLRVKYCGADLSILPQVLTKLPYLEVLILTRKDCYHDITCEAWKQEKSQIGCLKCSLKRLQVENLRVEEREIEMLEYFLENAKVLNEIRLVRGYRPYGHTDSAFLNKLLAFQRFSNAFKITIY